MTMSLAAPWRALGCVVAAAAAYTLAPEPHALRAGLALFVLIGALWMTQALHLTVTALLVPLLAVLAGLLELRTALASPARFRFHDGGLSFATAASIVPGARPSPAFAVTKA